MTSRSNYIPLTDSRYTEQLHRFSTPGTWIQAIIDEVGVTKQWWQAGRPWRRTFGRFDPGMNRYCTLLHETEDLPQALCVIEASTAEPTLCAANEWCAADNTLGWLRLTRFPHDPELTTLPAVWSDPADARVLRYRPRKRCTLRVEDAAGGRTRFAKVFTDGRGEAIAQTTEALWQCKGLGFNVAEPLGWDTDTRILWQGHVPGAPVAPRLLEHGDVELARAMGRACATIAKVPVKPAAELGARAQLKRTTRYGNELSRRVPALTRAIGDLLSELARIHETVTGQAQRPIHGAPHVHQWLDTGARLGLVDFDRFGLGAPELDVATFVAEMDFEIAARTPVNDLNQSFMRGYESVAGRLDRTLLQAYRVHKHVAKALKAARGVRVDGGERATQILNGARTRLTEQVLGP